MIVKFSIFSRAFAFHSNQHERTCAIAIHWDSGVNNGINTLRALLK